MDRKRVLLWTSMVLLSLFMVGSVWAVPGLINYQSKLTDAAGTPLDGTYTMEFYLYTAPTGGTLLWDEQQSVAVTEGIYTVQLGSVTPLDSNVFAGDEVYLEVAIYNPATASWETLSPRRMLTSTAYAFQAENAAMLEGHGSAEFAAAIHQHGGGDITSGTVDEARIDPDIARDAEITWGNLVGIPADIADGDQVGITTESDPQVGSNSTDYVPRWSGSALVKGTIYDNGTNIGIGTTTTPEKLTVEGGIAASRTSVPAASPATIPLVMGFTAGVSRI